LLTVLYLLFLEMAEAAAPKTKSPRRTKREETNPVPREFVGQTKTGIILDVLKNRTGGGRFGFISIGTDADKTTSPRIYFNTTSFTDDKYLARKGYAVSFKVAVDASDRLAAESVVLTPAGKAAAAEREATLAASAPKKQAAPKTEGAAAKAPRERRPREVDSRTVELKVTGEGLTGEKTVTAKLGESLGKLKHTCISAFESEDISLQVFHADGRLLTKEILGSMKAGEALRLKPKAA
jgi:hypothetical protein